MTSHRRRPQPTHAFAAATLSVAFALALTACGSSDNESSANTSASATTATTTGGATETTVADEPTPTSAPAKPATITAGKATIDVQVGKDDFKTLGGARVVSVPKGTAVTINLTNPTAAEEYHLHGYDIEQKADAGQTATLQFTADQTGQFDLESHVTEDTYLVLVVQ
jgi:ABC-type Fe3+-hydroxamate transport system substrate-binding protein